jgi:hypothetical protein
VFHSIGRGQSRSYIYRVRRSAFTLYRVIEDKL